ncbi:DEAD/DEAH box helicase family protein [Nodularia spumigena CS-584]|uniref:type I restriction endonuclease subunit R n=1 Tax=Nodularia spumigena TaxID=70799 RepID=UPI00036911CC|nr:type I restriction endonuclease [Nodularia spumigena]AHJ27607.1 Type I restriction-modification system, restriction subunit R [Nodularia spumigena CCY9414]MDB9382998.1 DEAD/DEAH box helicase family protein [Nodularia spumigena CS-584]
MVSKTNESALETCIETALIEGADYEKGNPADFNRKIAIDEEKFWRFLETTQPEELAKLQDRPNWKNLILERCDRKIKKDGILSVLKKGLSIDNAHLTLLYSQPYNDTNQAVTENFQKNIFSITRQVHYSQKDTALSIDIVLFINGCAIATIELKNPWTNQTVYHAKKQYRENRNPQEPLFQFARCLVHFAIDTDEVWMTTKLDREKTYFLPFNKGFNFGKGNPPNPKGHKSAYLWETILTRPSFTNIIEHFAILIPSDSKTSLIEKTLFFPRYHQLDVVRQLLTHAKINGTGQTYLIQHSAGSGKSNSITWITYQLIELYAQNADSPLFDSVVVVTDRRILDKQLKDNIKDFSQVKNIVAHATNSKDLKTALENGKKIIITTIQKFPFIIEGIEDLSKNTFAVIIDEAHSSQSGKAADNLNIALGKAEEEDEEDLQDKILKAMDGRKLSKNASYFAFTATPKNATLEKFGQPNPEGKFTPFHLYSMKQAIEEGFILDVLANYTTYKSYYEIKKSIQDNPDFNTTQAQKKLRAYVEGNKQTISTKAEIIVNHFITQVWQPKKLKGEGKAMVVTRNIEAAIRYFFAIRDLLTQAKVPFKAIIAFSGKKTIDGIEYTEEIINQFPSKDISDEFKKPDYKILVVANKFLTGFDEPLLHTMYVDKKLQSVTAVQTLSRLNRCNAKMGKQDTFILDFNNTVSDIQTAFDPFYTATSLSEPTDINVLHDLKEALDEVGVYEWSEIEKFNELFFNNVEAEKLSPLIDIAVARFSSELELEAASKIDFKIKAKQFVKIYGQVACMIPYNNLQWEMQYWFLKFLIPKLAVKNPEQDQLDQLLESVDLSTYAIERTKLNYSIKLDNSPSEIDPQNSNIRGYHSEAPQQDPLDEIIAAFNNRFFTDWDVTPEEQRVKFINIAQHVIENPDYKTQIVNNPDEQNRRLALEEFIKQAINKERKRELDLYKRYASDPEFKRVFDATIMQLLAQINLENPQQFEG